MSKYIRYKTAHAAPMYQEIRDEAIRLLVKHGRFSKAGVLHSTGYHIVADSVQWEHVIRMIEEAHEVELIGVVATFFKRKDENGNAMSDLINAVPERFIAGTAGAHRTAGFISVDARNDKLVMSKLHAQNEIVKGVIKKQVKKTLRGIERYKPLSEPQYTPPMLTMTTNGNG